MTRPFDSSDDGFGFVTALFKFILRDGVRYDAGASLDVTLVAVHEESADGDAGVEIAGKVRVEDAAAVDAATGGFELFDNLHRADFGCSRERACGETGAERVDGSQIFEELAFDTRHQVHDVRVALDEHKVFGLYAAELGDATDIVAAEVDEHDVLGYFFGVVAEVFFERSVGGFIRAAGAGAGDGTVLYVAGVLSGGHADEEFGG